MYDDHQRRPSRSGWKSRPPRGLGRPERARPTLPLGFVLIVALALGCAATGWSLYLDFTADDAAISFSYARSLAEGRGMVLGEGGERVEGYSNFLWVLFLACGIMQGLDPLVLAKGAGLLSAWWVLILLAWFPSRLLDRSPRALDALGALLLSLATPFVFWSAGGLETLTFTALLLSALHLLEGELRKPRAFPFSALAAVAMSLTRPEGAILALGLLAGRVVSGGVRPGSGTTLWGMTFALPLALYHFGRYHYFGFWAPTTWLVKLPPSVVKGQLLWWDSSGWLYVREFLEMRVPPLFLVLALMGVPAFFRSASGLPLLLAGLGTWLFPVAVAGDWMQAHRLLVPALPFLFLALTMGVEALIEFLFQPDPVRLRLDLPSTATLVLILYIGGRALHVAGLGGAGRPVPYRVTMESRVARARALQSRARALGLDHFTHAEADVGGVAWETGRAPVDLTGLTDLTLSRHGRHPWVVRRYLLDLRKPTFIRLEGVWGEETGLAGSAALARDYIEMGALEGDAEGARNYVRRELLTVREVPERARLRFNFSGEVDLLGARSASSVVAPGTLLTVHLYWKGRTPRPGRYEAELLFEEAASGRVIERAAVPLGHGWYPPVNWRSSEIVRDTWRWIVPEELPEGTYRLAVGLNGPDGPVLVEGQLPRAMVGLIRVSRTEAEALAARLVTGSPRLAREGRWNEVLKNLREARALVGGDVPPALERSLDKVEGRAQRESLTLLEKDLEEGRLTTVLQALEENVLALEKTPEGRTRLPVLRRRIGSALVGEGRRSLGKGRWLEAVRRLDEAVRADPASTEARRLRARAWDLAFRRRLDAIEKNYEALMEKEGDASKVRLKAAAALFREGAWERALKQLDLIPAEGAPPGQVAYLQSLCLFKLERTRESLARLDEARAAGYPVPAQFASALQRG